MTSDRSLRLKIKRSAFTLVELLVVIAIIGLMSSAALVYLKDTADVKALSYTNKASDLMKSAIASMDSEEYFVGFVNDFGTMPPNVYFLLGTQDDNKSFNFVGEKDNITKRAILIKNRFDKMYEQNATSLVLPAPFMNKSASSIFYDDLNSNGSLDVNDELKGVVYAGFEGKYIMDVNDGWGMPMRLRNDFNISGTKDMFLTLLSSGSDRAFEGESLARSEFDLSKDVKSIESLYADDLNVSYKKSDFLVRSLEIDIKLSTQASSADAVALIFYSPMLYYVEDSESKECFEHNTTHAKCASDYKKYIAYYAFEGGFDKDIADKNVSWHVGLMKQQLFIDNNSSKLFINKSAIADNDFSAYKFKDSSDTSLSDSAFFDAIVIRDANGTKRDWDFTSEPKDMQNPFYMFAGAKTVSVWYRDGSWKRDDTLSIDFKPNRRQKIVIECK